MITEVNAAGCRSRVAEMARDPVGTGSPTSASVAMSATVATTDLRRMYQATIAQMGYPCGLRAGFDALPIAYQIGFRCGGATSGPSRRSRQRTTVPPASPGSSTLP